MREKDLIKKIGLSETQIQRYSRQILLKEVGALGMKKLLSSQITIVGGGGLGCPSAQILATSGVGRIKIIDGDIVDLSNLPRQLLHTTEDIGRLKVDSIKEKIEKLNPDVNVEIIPTFLTKENALKYLKHSDYVIDASDNPSTKFLINDVCIHLNIPFTIAGVVQFYGQLISIIPGETTCYRCVYPKRFEMNEAESCSGAGVMSTVPAVAGIIQANEAILYLLQKKMNYLNRMLCFDLLDGSFSNIDIKKNPQCAACQDPSVEFYLTEDYNPKERFCSQ